jgi:hypothetical protein
MLLHKYSKTVNRIENNRIEWCESKSNRIVKFVNRCSPTINPSLGEDNEKLSKYRARFSSNGK